MELDAFKARLIKEICQADSLEEVLDVAHNCTAESYGGNLYPPHRPDGTAQARETPVAYGAAAATADMTEAGHALHGWGRVPGVPCTAEEVRKQIAAYEREKAVGIVGISEEEAEAEILREMPWLR